MRSPNTFLIPLITLLSLTSAYDTTVKHFDCGTTADGGSAGFNLTIAALSAANAASSGSLAARASTLVSRGSAIKIPLFIHVVTTKSKKGSITPTMVKAQADALNAAYKSANIVFSYQGATFTANDVWAVGANEADDRAMKKSLRKGTYGSLNLYMQSDLYGGILGKCSLPSMISDQPLTVKVPKDVYFTDGCNINAGTMPGGVIDGYNHGMTAVHETGHWMGLLHTFEGYSCEGPGDYIDDTPAQSESTDGCPSGVKDSCPGLPGVDLIHNYMDYSIDECYEGWTPGQVARMADVFASLRRGR